MSLVDNQQPVQQQPQDYVDDGHQNDDDQSAAHHSRANTNDPMTIRALLNSKGAGIVIGKAGKTVEELREKTGVKAGVSKVVEGVNDRVLTVSGTVDEIANAFGLIVQLLIDTPPSLQPPVDPSVTVVRLLVPNTLMGSIIGRAGAKIKQIQDDHHVKLVAQKEPLPASTERVVEITGDAQGIEGAVREIADALLDDWERGMQNARLYDPKVRASGYPPMGGNGAGGYSGSNNNGSSGAGGAGGNVSMRSSLGFGSASSSSGQQRRYDSDNGNRYRRTGRGDDFTSRSGSGSGSGGNREYVARSDDPNAKTQTIAIPSDMVGCIIGKGGSRIGEIRASSGCHISISKLPNESGERLFTIVGSQEANERALKMLYEQLESERERRNTHNAGDDQSLAE
ncbi:RNA binding protein, heterogenous nuclear RNP-K like protein [Sorochytrium milnesiophthora]